MLSAYPAIFYKEPSGYSVVFPDLGDLTTCGETLNEALAMAIDCLAGYLYTLKRAGKKAPEPSDLRALRPDYPEVEHFTNIVTVDVNDYAKHHFEKSVKKTLTIPSWLNDAAEAAHLNFSSILQSGLKQQLHLD